MRIRLFNRWVWTPTRWQRATGTVLGLAVWTAAWVLFGMMIVDGLTNCPM